MKILEYLKKLKGKDIGDKNLEDVQERTDESLNINTQQMNKGNDENKKESLETITFSKEMYINVMKELRKETKQSMIHISLQDSGTALTDSKFGGIPYLPSGTKVPVDQGGRQMRLLAQINADQLPESDHWLDKGILQFWVLSDQLTGLDFDNQCSGSKSKVVYYDEIDSSITEQQVLAQYQPYMEDDDFPVKGEFKLVFDSGEEGITIEDYKFEESFIKKWNELFPGLMIESYRDLPYEITKEMYDEYSGFEHKIGGYPAFTQGDVRTKREIYKDKNMLLLQIDSAGTKNNEIMWGDSGVCNFFISEDAWKNKDFSEVLYNWDCY